MSRNTRKPKPNNQADIFFKESKLAFHSRYKATSQAYVLIARDMLEASVDQGLLSAQEALLILRTPQAFAEYLSEAERNYKGQEDQKIHDRMTNLERNTDWKAAAAVSLGAGMVTGIVFALASPFITTWLQPTADELFKRQPTAQATVTTPLPTQNITTNIYIFSAPEAKSAPAPLPSDDKKPKATLTCKNMTINAYKASLPELLQRGEVVTLEMNGKKVSMCYRPSVQHTTQQQVLTK